MFVKWNSPRILRSAGGGDGGAGGGGGTGEDQGSAPKWFETDRWGDEARGYIEAKGLNKFEDPNEAISHMIGIGQAADKRFGRPIDTVMDKPTDGQPLQEWRRENAALIGIPEKADGYTFERPKDLPESIAWDSGFEDRFRALAYERGLSQDDVSAMTGFYAEHVKGLSSGVDAEFERANSAMMGELQKDWGSGTEEKIAQARQAVQVIGERAGLETGGIEAVASVLTTKGGGDAAAIRFFAALGEMLGEDKGRGIGAGNGGGGMTPAEAGAKLKEMRAPGGAFYEAKTAADRARVADEIERLTKIAMGNSRG